MVKVVVYLLTHVSFGSGNPHVGVRATQATAAHAGNTGRDLHETEKGAYTKRRFATPGVVAGAHN